MSTPEEIIRLTIVNKITKLLCLNKQTESQSHRLVFKTAYNDMRQTVYEQIVEKVGGPVHLNTKL